MLENLSSIYDNKKFTREKMYSNHLKQAVVHVKSHSALAKFSAPTSRFPPTRGRQRVPTLRPWALSATSQYLARHFVLDLTEIGNTPNLVLPIN